MSVADDLITANVSNLTWAVTPGTNISQEPTHNTHWITTCSIEDKSMLDCFISRRSVSTSVLLPC